MICPLGDEGAIRPLSHASNIVHLARSVSEIALSAGRVSLEYSKDNRPRDPEYWLLYFFQSQSLVAGSYKKKQYHAKVDISLSHLLSV